MIVLGIDPGIAITGCAVVEETSGNVRLRLHRAITTPATDLLARRLTVLHDEVTLLLRTIRPDAAAIERLFFNTNAKTAFTVGQSRGVILLAVAQYNVPIAEYTPLQVKMALTGWGRADKKQIQRMVAQVLNLSTPITQDDAADAAAIAITHCFSYKIGELKSKK